VELRQDAAEGAVFAVHDSGAGIPPEARDKLFDAFFSTKPDGLGMGLAISRTIVENHGGRLGLDTAAEAGTRFVFNIPAI
jgi:signal transduction histidine kinase